MTHSRTHYSSEQQDSKPVERKITARLRGEELQFFSVAGVFSKKKIDLGTEILIENAVVKPEWKILDLGCGYGPVGVALAKAFPSAKIVMSDVNRRAVLAAKKNAELNRVGNAEVVFSDFYSGVSGEFDTIIINPPQKAGKEVCFRMITESKEHLRKGGLLQIVARHQKGGKSLSDKMMETFKNVTVIARESGYRVYSSERKD